MSGIPGSRTIAALPPRLFLGMQEVSRPRDVSGPGGFHPLARRFAATNPGSPVIGGSNAKPLSIGIQLTDHVDFDIGRPRIRQQDSC
jgi:hypothetical protein